MEREDNLMKSVFLAIFISLFLAGSAACAPYTSQTPKSNTSELYGPIKVVTCTTGNLVGTDCGDQYTMFGSVIELVSGTITLPSALQGMWACVKATSAAAINIDVQGTDNWNLDGTALSNGDKITSDGSDDATICFYSNTDTEWTTIHNPWSFTDGN
jgi:hypothetical protein